MFSHPIFRGWWIVVAVLCIGPAYLLALLWMALVEWWKGEDE